MSVAVASLCALVLAAGCQSDTSATPPTPTLSAHSNGDALAASQSAASASWFSALASAEASIDAQVAPLTDAQRRALAIQWEAEPISGDPIQTARERWVGLYAALASSAAANASKCETLAGDAFPDHFGVGQTTDEHAQEDIARRNMFSDCMAGRLP